MAAKSLCLLRAVFSKSSRTLSPSSQTPRYAAGPGRRKANAAKAAAEEAVKNTKGEIDLAARNRVGCHGGSNCGTAQVPPEEIDQPATPAIENPALAGF